MKALSGILILVGLILVISACGSKQTDSAEKPDRKPDAGAEEIAVEKEDDRKTYTLSSTVGDVVSDPYFEDFGYMAAIRELDEKESLFFSHYAPATVEMMAGLQR